MADIDTDAEREQVEDGGAVQRYHLCHRYLNELDRLQAENQRLTDEIESVLQLMDGLAEQWGDEAVFRRCRDRLRALTKEAGE